MRLHQLILATHRMTLIDLYAASTINSCARLLSSERVSVCVCVLMCRASLQPQPQQQPQLQQMLTQNFAVHNWNSTSHYQPYNQPAAPLDPGQFT